MHPIRRPAVIAPAVALALLLLPTPGCNPGIPGGNDLGGGTGTFNTPPTAMASADVVRGIVPLTVHFDSSRSADPGGYIASRQWDFGDGGTSTDIAPTHVYTTSGQFTVTLTVTDNAGATGTDDRLAVSVTQAPVPIIQVDKLTAEFAPATITFDGSQSYDPDGSIAAYLWNFGDGAQESLQQVKHTFSRPGNYRVRLTVTDNVGVKSFAERVIVVGIGKPVISFRVPDDSITNIALAREAPLWVAATFEVEPGTPYMISAGLDRDHDPCDAQAAVYDPKTGDLLEQLLGAEQPVRTAAFSPDGTLVLLAGDDGDIRSYDVEGNLLTTVSSGAPAVNSLAFSPDGSRYVCGGSDGSLVLRETYSGQVLLTLQSAPDFPINCVAFSPNGQLVASGSDDPTASAAIWRAGSAASSPIVLGASIGGHAAAVNAVAFSPTNFDYLATGSADHTAKIWQLSRMAPMLTCAGHTDEVTSVAFSSDGLLLATGSRDRSAALWNVQAGAGTPVTTFPGLDAPVTSLAFSPDRKQLLLGCADGAARIYDLATKVEVQTLQPCSSAITSACYDEQGSMVLLGVAAENSIRLDTVKPGGGDLDLDVPTPLDLRTLTGDQLSDACGYPGCNPPYYLWVALDTDITEPVRGYANATVQVLKSATTGISESTPQVPLVENKAVIVAAATPARQVFDLGSLKAGDQLKLSLADMPGYTPVYDDSVYSVLVLDSAQAMFAWYQNPGPYWDAGHLYWPGDRVPMSADDMLTIGHPSNYYLVLDGCTREKCGDEFLTPSVCVEVVPSASDEVHTPREQRVYLNFDTALQNVPIWDDHIDIPAFDAEDLSPGWDTAEMKTGITNRLKDIFGGYNVFFFDSEPAQPYLSVYFGGGSADFWIAWTDYLDPRNQTRNGTAYVFSQTIATTYDGLLDSETDMANALANVAAQQIGLLIGLRNSASGSGDIMDPDLTASEASIKSTVEFTDSEPLNASEQFNGQMGTQNARELLSEIVGGPG
jgi:WD40 repeat protein